MSSIKDKLDKIGMDQAKESFVDSFLENNDKETLIEEGLGIVLSRWADYTGARILKVAMLALEDSNFHDEAEKIQEMMEK